MAGNPSNVSLWDEADVYVIFPEDMAPGTDIEDYLPDTPADEWPEPWQPAGLLDGGAGFEESRDRDNTKHPAWGMGTILSSFKDFEMERKLTCLEDNPVTARLKSNNDTDTHVVVSTHTPAYLGFETRDRRGKKRRRATMRTADVVYEGATENDSDLDAAEFTAMIYPDGAKRLLWKQDENSIAGGGVVAGGAEEWDLSITATGGTLVLTYRGNSTAPVAYDAANAAIKTALVALDDGFVAADWSVTGASPTRIKLPRKGLLAVNVSGLTGGTATLTAV